MPRLRSAVLALLGAAAVGAGAFVVIGPARIWDRLAGPADQGPVDFATLQRRDVPNDALACSPGACPARADLELPVYGGEPSVLLDAVEAAVRREGHADCVDRGSDPLYRRYVLRTPILRFPDTLDVRAVRTPAGVALLLYSRSLLGKGDFGANRARLERITAGLGGSA